MVVGADSSILGSSKCRRDPEVDTQSLAYAEDCIKIIYRLFQ